MKKNQKNSHGADNLIQTAFVKLIWLNTLLTGDITNALSTFPSCLFISSDCFLLFFKVRLLLTSEQKELNLAVDLHLLQKPDPWM